MPSHQFRARAVALLAVSVTAGVAAVCTAASPATTPAAAPPGAAAPSPATAAAPSGAAAPSLAAASSPATLAAPADDPFGCLHTGNGFLRAKIRGAVNLDLDWHNAEMQCDGGARPNKSGVRVSFAGPKSSDGRRVRMVFGVGSATEGRGGRALPTNLTVIFEGEKRLFATRGQDRCTVDQLAQERVGDLGGPFRTYRIVAHGFCISPANSLDDSTHILVSSFDFAGRVTFGD
jgi:hypothetical protein